MADTLRLRKLQQQPAHVERLLETLVLRATLVSDSAYQIRDVASLPVDLRRIALRAISNGQTWTCWVDGIHTRLFTGEMSLALSRERGRPVMQVEFYDDDGLKDSGPWIADADGKWQRLS